MRTFPRCRRSRWCCGKIAERSTSAAFCYECYQELDETEAKYSSCPYCYHPLGNLDISVNETLIEKQEALVIECLNPNCISYIEYLDSSCEDCGVKFVETDWDDFYASASPETVQKIDAFYSDDDPWMICCDQTWAACLCVKPLSWEDTSDVPPGIWDSLYNEDDQYSLCKDCVNYYTEKCPEIRKSVADFLYHGVIGEKIITCESFDYDHLVVENTFEKSSTNSEKLFIDYKEF